MNIEIKLDNTEKIIEMIRANGQRALIAGATEAVGCIKDEMEFGYGKPIRKTGNLIGSISYNPPRSEPNLSIDIGTDIEYGKFVHEGTRRMRGRPFITDALTQNKERIAQVLMQELKRGFG